MSASTTDVFIPQQRSAVMRAVKGRNTVPEMMVRRAVHAMGRRFRLHRRDLPGAPDLVLARHRIAIFVHGCFWHGHDCARGARAPKQNAAYWRDKIARNRARDTRNVGALETAGWRVIVVWECDLRRAGWRDRLADALGDVSGAAR